MFKSKKFIIAAVIVLVLLIVIFVWFLVKNRSGQQVSQQTPQKGQVQDFLSQGKLPPDLPEGLFSDPASNITNGYVIPYANGEQNTVVYTTKYPLAQVFSYYLSYLSQHNYTILNNWLKPNSAKPTTGMLYATSGSGDMSINFSASSGVTQVNISYLKK